MASNNNCLFGAVQSEFFKPVFSRTNMHVSTAEYLTCKPVEQLEDKHAKEREMTEILQSANCKVHRNNILMIAEG